MRSPEAPKSAPSPPFRPPNSPPLLEFRKATPASTPCERRSLRRDRVQRTAPRNWAPSRRGEGRAGRGTAARALAGNRGEDRCERRDRTRQRRLRESDRNNGTQKNDGSEEKEAEREAEGRTRPVQAVGFQQINEEDGRLEAEQVLRVHREGETKRGEKRVVL